MGSDIVRRDLRVLAGSPDCTFFDVFRVFLTGASPEGSLVAVRLVFRTGLSGSIEVGFAGPLGRIPGLDLLVVLEGPVGLEDVGGPDLSERMGGPLVCVGGPLVCVGGPLPFPLVCPRLGGAL